MRRRSMAAAGLAIALVLTACGQEGGSGGDDRTDGERGTFTYAVGNEPTTFNPALQDVHTDPVTELVFRGLTAHNADNEVVPSLAKSWTISPDGTTYTFDLRTDVTWHDGRPFTSADVKFTIEAIQQAGANAPRSRNFEMVEAVRTEGPHTLRLELSEPFAPMLDALSMGVLPKHLLQGKKLTDPSFGRHPIGTGPFELTTYESGRYAELTAYDDYFERKPGLHSIVITYVPDDSTRFIQLSSGDVDGAHLRPQQVKRAKQVDGVAVRINPTADYRALMFNMPKLPQLADPRVRKAMNYAIDRKAIVSSVLHGFGEPAKGPLDQSKYAGSLGYTFDPGKVARLMKSAGYQKSSDGLWQKNGKPIEFELSTFAEDSARVAILQVSATQLKKQGFDVEPKPRPADWVRQHWAGLEGFVVGWGSPFDPDTSAYGPFHSSEALANGGSNYGSYANETVDKALDAGRAATEEADRRQAYDTFQEALFADPPFVWIAYLKAINAVPANLKGMRQRTLGHHGYGFFWNAAEWHYTDS